MDSKIWIRVGGFVSADYDECVKIMDGDTDALVNAIKNNGFEVNGDTYIPTDGWDVEFNLDSLKLVATDGGNV